MAFFEFVEEQAWFIEEKKVRIQIGDLTDCRVPFKYDLRQERRQSPAVFPNGPLAFYGPETVCFDLFERDQADEGKRKMRQLIVHHLVHAKDPKMERLSLLDKGCMKSQTVGKKGLIEQGSEMLDRFTGNHSRP